MALKLSPIFSCLILLFFSIISLTTKANCLKEQNIKQLDAQYEKSLVTDNYMFLKKTLHPNFIWIHNHASYVQNSRKEIVEPMRERVKNNTPPHNAKRTQRDVQVLTAHRTAVIHGFTDVERTNAALTPAGTPEYTRYHFMRTYFKRKKKCYLLSNHTMEIPQVENN